MKQLQQRSALTMLRRKSVIAESGLKNTNLYYHISKGLFTSPVKLGARCSAWPSFEVEAINAARIAGKTDDEIRELVAKLETDRMVLA